MTSNINHKKVCELIIKQSKGAMDKLILAINNSNVPQYSYARNGRIKNIERLIEKIQSKQTTEPDYSPFSPKDIIGIRIVTLLHEDSVPALDSILSRISENSIFLDKKLNKAKIFTSTLTKHSIAESIKATIINSECDVDPKEIKTLRTDTGYSCTHLITRLDINLDVNAFSSELDDETLCYYSDVLLTYKIPCEIQVRNVFEDAWGEIDHRYGYELRRSNKISSSKTWQHLRTLKNFVDTCSEYASIISELDTNNIAYSNDTFSNIYSIDKIEQAVSLLNSNGVEKSLVSQYEKLKMQINVVLSNNYDEYQRIHSLQEIADSFGNFCRSNQQYIHSGLPGSRQLLFLIKMDKALCLLQTRLEVNLNEAIYIYESLHQKFPNNLIRKFRLAECYLFLKKQDIALVEFERTQILIEQIENAINSDIIDNLKQDELIFDNDLEYIKIFVPKYIGYIKWVQSQRLTDIDERIDFIDEAYSETKDSLDCLLQYPKALNDHERKTQNLELLCNLIYFASESIFFERKLEQDDKTDETEQTDPNNDSTSLDQISEDLEKVETLISDNLSEVDIDYLDSILVGYWTLDNKERIDTISKTIEEKLSVLSRENLSTFHAVIFQRLRNIELGKDIFS